MSAESIMNRRGFLKGMLGLSLLPLVSFIPQPLAYQFNSIVGNFEEYIGQMIWIDEDLYEIVSYDGSSAILSPRWASKEGWILDTFKLI